MWHCVSDKVVSNTGAPQGTVLSPFLFTTYTTDFSYCTDTCHLQKFSDDSAVVGCIREDICRKMLRMFYESMVANVILYTFVCWGSSLRVADAFHFICENFEEVSLCEEFLQLAEQELADILGQDDLTVTQESTVYQSVLRWINHMPEERQGAISTLLPKVRLGLMDKSYITDNVLNNDVVKTNPEFHLLVSDTLKVMSQPSLLCSESGINNTLFCRRLPNTMENPVTHLCFYSTVFLGRCFYIVGSGLSWTDPCIRVWRYNLVTHTWQEMSPMQESRYLMSVTVLKVYIYAMGGYRDDDGSLLRTAERYQPNINQWTFIASMNEGRIRASCTTLNNKIYICGGWSNRSLNTAEYYNPDTNQWTLITPMGTPRCGLGVVAYMGHIFAVGGRDGSRCLRSAEAYDPVTNTWYDVPEMVHRHNLWRYNLVTHTWQEMSPMQESRYLMSVTVLKGCIYAMGGYRDDDGTLLRTAERYQPNINQWTFIASMNEERIRASCTTLNNKIYICGGCINRVLNTAEYYNPDTNQWTLITPMGTPRYDLGVVAYMGHIFAVGGRDGSRYQRSAEAYDPVTNTCATATFKIALWYYTLNHQCQMYGLGSKSGPAINI
uniref:BACK domain-containing protein n=1 Tax=Gouania willdenowi TaxID=441366 RepID=A0A8C5DDN1_GOUWI